MIKQAAHVRRHLGAVRGYQTCVAVGAEILCGIEAERRRDAHGSCVTDFIPLVSPARSKWFARRLRSRTGGTRQPAAGTIHVGALAVEMNREQRAEFVALAAV